MAKYTHCTFRRAWVSSAVLRKKTYEPSTGATTVPTPLNAWEMLILISAYRGGPHTTHPLHQDGNLQMITRDRTGEQEIYL